MENKQFEEMEPTKMWLAFEFEKGEQFIDFIYDNLCEFEKRGKVVLLEETEKHAIMKEVDKLDLLAEVLELPDSVLGEKRSDLEGAYASLSFDIDKLSKCITKGLRVFGMF